MLASDSSELCERMFFVLLMTSQLSRRAALPFFNPDTRTFDVWSTGSEREEKIGSNQERARWWMGGQWVRTRTRNTFDGWIRWTAPDIVGRCVVRRLVRGQFFGDFIRLASAALKAQLISNGNSGAMHYRNSPERSMATSVDW